MPKHGALSGRLARLERAVPRRCAACSGRAAHGVVFRFEGVLQTACGLPVDESELGPCPQCGSGHSGQTLGLKVIEGVDPLAL